MSFLAALGADPPPVAPFKERVPPLREAIVELKEATAELKKATEDFSRNKWRDLDPRVYAVLAQKVFLGAFKARNILSVEDPLCLAQDLVRYPLAFQGIKDARKLLRVEVPDDKFSREFIARAFSTGLSAHLARISRRNLLWRLRYRCQFARPNVKNRFATSPLKPGSSDRCAEQGLDRRERGEIAVHPERS
jgi:hypothetical protein